MNRTLLQITGQAENRFYGHINILAKYCGLNGTPWLNGYLQHGWNGCDGFSNYAGHKRISQKFIWSERALQDQINLGGKNTFVIGSPWLYNLKIHEFNKTSSINKRVIAYPLHSQPWAPKNYLHSEYAKFLKTKFGEVTVSLHWSDFSKTDIRNTYSDYGHETVTNGVGTPWVKNFDPNFLNNQLKFLSNHEILTTNAMQTSVLYAMSLGLKIDFGGPASWGKKVDEYGTYGNYGQQHWLNKVKNEYDEFWREELGEKEIKNPESLLNILGWNNPSIKMSYIFSRIKDLTTDASVSEKFSYFLKGRR